MNFRNRTVGTGFVATGLALALLALSACASLTPDTTTVEVTRCGPDLDEVCPKITVVWKKSTADGDDLARDLVVTREFDPDLLTYAGGPATGSIKLTLNDGTIVSYTGNLAYSSYWSSRIPARTSGNMVFGFVASNPSAVQSFLDQYRSRTVSLQYTSTVRLATVWSGDEIAASIESQASHQGTRAFLGGGVARVGSRDGDGKPEI